MMRHEIVLRRTSNNWYSYWTDEQDKFSLCNPELQFWFKLPNHVRTIYVILTKTPKKESIHLRMRSDWCNTLIPNIKNSSGYWERPFTYATDTSIKLLLKRLKIKECYITIEYE